MDKVMFISILTALLVVAIAIIFYNAHVAKEYERLLRETGPKVKYRTAVHEAGHALAVIRGNRVKGRLLTVTTVPGENYSGIVRYNLMGFPIFVQWERVIVALGGIAGEMVARGEFDAHACSADLEQALEMAALISDSHQMEEVKPLLDLQPYYKRPLLPTERNVLNFCMNQALTRLRENQSDFYRLVDSLIERRELTGAQVLEVLSNR